MYNTNNYINIPPNFLVVGLRKVPFLFWHLGHSLELSIECIIKIGLENSVIEFLVDIDAVDLLAVGLVLHQKEGVVIGFRGEGVKFGGLVDLEVVVDLL